MASVAFHALLLLLFIGPIWMGTVLEPRAQGAGGPGPAGGGGGGTGGTGGSVKERLRYMLLVPVPPQPKPAVQQVVPPVVKPPLPEPPKPEPAKVVPQQAGEADRDASQVSGTGGGSGHDGSTGSGPGTGGGVGSGDGTGRGSSRGPGTGGGEGRVYPPTVTNLAILPIPVPSRVRPYKMIAYFEVDERGNSKLISFNPSKDSDYNRKLRSMLDEVRFRPAVGLDGVPVRDTTWISAEAP